MVGLFRRFVLAFVALTLLLTAETMAMARGANAAVSEIILCHGTTTITLHLDAQGEPTEAPHICPDCALFFVWLQKDSPEAILAAQTLSAPPFAAVLPAASRRASAHKTARGPPCFS